MQKSFRQVATGVCADVQRDVVSKSMKAGGRYFKGSIIAMTALK